jgi:hypothetical protein
MRLNYRLLYIIDFRVKTAFFPFWHALCFRLSVRETPGQHNKTSTKELTMIPLLPILGGIASVTTIIKNIRDI